ncbi:MAG: Carbamoyl-phosphate synthase chain ATP-binding protein, partial [Actinotalea sp.]|nr:Carbamoyl-phosphate synthase chain ATP-binding protein [Actinotalea sp.]
SVLGVHTNVGYLRDVLRDPDVVAGDLDTHLLERRGDVLPADPEPAVLAAAVLWLRARTDDDARAEQTSTPGTTRTPVTASTSTGSGTPWLRDGWRFGEHLPTRYHLATGSGEVVEVAVGGTAQEPAVRVGDRAPVHAVLVGRTTDTVTVEHEGVLRTFHIAADGDVVWVGDHGAVVELRLRSRADLLAEQLTGLSRDPGDVSPEVRSPMPGTVVSVSVETGESVTAGQTLLTVEAMKMEHRLVATTSGIVTLSARPADRVKLDQVVATIAPHPLEGDPS